MYIFNVHYPSKKKKIQGDKSLGLNDYINNNTAENTTTTITRLSATVVNVALMVRGTRVNFTLDKKINK